jgi:hypothetical protein
MPDPVVDPVVPGDGLAPELSEPVADGVPVCGVPEPEVGRGWAGAPQATRLAMAMASTPLATHDLATGALRLNRFLASSTMSELPDPLLVHNGLSPVREGTLGMPSRNAVMHLMA